MFDMVSTTYREMAWRAEMPIRRERRKIVGVKRATPSGKGNRAAPRSAIAGVALEAD